MMPRAIRRCFGGIAFVALFAAGCASEKKPTADATAKVEKKAEPARTTIDWVATWPAAQKQATDSKKLIMIDFYTGWCHWCKVLDEKTYPDSRVVKLAGDVVSIKLDAEKKPGAELARKYGVNGYPAIVFVDEGGRSVGRIDGYLPPEQFAPMMKNIIERHGK